MWTFKVRILQRVIFQNTIYCIVWCNPPSVSCPLLMFTQPSSRVSLSLSSSHTSLLIVSLPFLSRYASWTVPQSLLFDPTAFSPCPSSFPLPSPSHLPPFLLPWSPCMANPKSCKQFRIYESLYKDNDAANTIILMYKLLSNLELSCQKLWILHEKIAQGYRHCL